MRKAKVAVKEAAMPITTTTVFDDINSEVDFSTKMKWAIGKSAKVEYYFGENKTLSITALNERAVPQDNKDDLWFGAKFQTKRNKFFTIRKKGEIMKMFHTKADDYGPTPLICAHCGAIAEERYDTMGELVWIHPEPEYDLVERDLEWIDDFGDDEIESDETEWVNEPNCIFQKGDVMTTENSYRQGIYHSAEIAAMKSFDVFDKNDNISYIKGRKKLNKNVMEWIMHNDTKLREIAALTSFNDEEREVAYQEQKDNEDGSVAKRETSNTDDVPTEYSLDATEKTKEYLQFERTLVNILKGKYSTAWSKNYMRSMYKKYPEDVLYVAHILGWIPEDPNPTTPRPKTTTKGEKNKVTRTIWMKKQVKTKTIQKKWYGNKLKHAYPQWNAVVKNEILEVRISRSYKYSGEAYVEFKATYNNQIIQLGRVNKNNFHWIMKEGPKDSDISGIIALWDTYLMTHPEINVTINNIR